VKQAGWSLFLQLAISDETAFPTADSMVDKFTYTILRASEQSSQVVYQTMLCFCPMVDRNVEMPSKLKNVLSGISEGTVVKKI
jgi:hypothetical protein